MRGIFPQGKAWYTEGGKSEVMEVLYERERKIIRLWFDMWIKKADLGIDNIFTDDVVYTESWSPKYENRKTVKHWFDEWNTRGSVLVWEIKQFFIKAIKQSWSGILKQNE